MYAAAFPDVSRASIYSLNSAAFLSFVTVPSVSLKGSPVKISVPGFSFCACTASDWAAFSIIYSVSLLVYPMEPLLEEAMEFLLGFAIPTTRSFSALSYR
jgi:hypothetical protein